MYALPAMGLDRSSSTATGAGIRSFQRHRVVRSVEGEGEVARSRSLTCPVAPHLSSQAQAEDLHHVEENSQDADTVVYATRSCTSTRTIVACRASPSSVPGRHADVSAPSYPMSPFLGTAPRKTAAADASVLRVYPPIPVSLREWCFWTSLQLWKFDAAMPAHAYLGERC